MVRLANFASGEDFKMTRSIYVMLAWLLSLAWAQQLQNATSSVSYPGLSASCQNALNTSVACPAMLYPQSIYPSLLNTNAVQTLCVSSCYNSLQSARSTIAGACTASTDVIVFDTGVAYPATYFVDSYLLAYNTSCRTDSTGAFCDPQMLSWQQQANGISTNQSCSNCWLGVLAVQLNNPLGYDAGLASEFASMTSSCNATAYPVTSPTAYALNSTATVAPAMTTPTPPPGCTGSYTVLDTDTCISVSQELNVSTYNLIYYNNLDLYCQNLATANGSTLCVPPTCKTYTWKGSDTCNSVVSVLSGVTLTQFLSWNPNLNSLCQNSGLFVGYQFCIGPPGGYLSPQINGTGTNGTSSNSTGAITATGATTAATVPTNAMSGTNKDCGAWYTVVAGDTCAHVSIAYSISLANFYFLNPELNSNCTNLELGEAYCVEAVGNIQTYSGYPTNTGPTITVPPVTFAPVNTQIPTWSANPGPAYTSSLLPMASGTLSGCYSYRNANVSLDGLNNCSYIAYAYQVTTDDLLQWNPSLSSNMSTCTLQSGYSYCVSPNNTDYEVPDYSNCFPANHTTRLPGTASNCGCYTLIQGSDNGTYGCADLESDFNLTASQLTSWNTWLSPNCDVNLYQNLSVSSTRGVCVSINGSQPVFSSTTSSSTTSHSSTTSTSSSTSITTSHTSTTTSTSSTTSTTASMGPTPSNTVPGCQAFYTVKSGDSCSSIETVYGITFAQFYSWNPSVGNNCQSLWVGEAYCVKGPASTSGSSTAASTPNAPTQSGIATNCNKYYLVQNGDSCPGIETTFNITWAQFYKWNPALGSNCQSLWVGDDVCVGAPS